MATFEVSNNVFIKALSMNSQTQILALSTAGKFVDKNISVNISVPTATFITTSTNGTLNSTYVASNITTTSTNNFNNDISITYSATATGSTYYISSNTAGYINASTTASSGSIADQSTTATYYIQGVTLNKPASGEAKFSITVPNGESNDMITFVFHADSFGNVVVDDSTEDAFS